MVQIWYVNLFELWRYACFKEKWLVPQVKLSDIPTLGPLEFCFL
jgi:hypothetical protein